MRLWFYVQLTMFSRAKILIIFIAKCLIFRNVSAAIRAYDHIFNRFNRILWIVSLGFLNLDQPENKDRNDD